jgi:hypothetical protein
MSKQTKKLATEITEAAPRVAEEHDLFREAVDGVNKWEGYVLRGVLEKLDPALEALGGRVQRQQGPNGKREYFDWRGLRLPSPKQGYAYHLVTEGGQESGFWLQRGTFVRVVHLTNKNGWRGAAMPVTVERAVEAVGVGNILEAINTALAQQLAGAKRKRTREARQRAKLLEAVLTLVSGYEAPVDLRYERATYLKAASTIQAACGEMEALEPRRRLWVLVYVADRAAVLLQGLASEIGGLVGSFEDHLNGAAPIAEAVKAADEISEWHPNCVMQLVEALAGAVYELADTDDPGAVEALRLGAERFVKGIDGSVDSLEDTERRVALLEETLRKAIGFAREWEPEKPPKPSRGNSNGRKGPSRKVAP